MKNLEDFMSTPPVVEFKWTDPETGAVGYLILNSLKGGAAAGGTRMRKGLTQEEVLNLAKVMEIKFTVSGPAIGGAKSGIDFDPEDPRAQLVLDRWFSFISPILQSYYGTGGDQNVGESLVIEKTKNLGIHCPLEGVLVGNYHYDEERVKEVGQQLVEGVSLIDDSFGIDFTVADLATGRGVVSSLSSLISLRDSKDDFTRMSASIQGFGNVGIATALYFTLHGGLISTIMDQDTVLFSKENKGFDYEYIRELAERSASSKRIVDENAIEYQRGDALYTKFWDAKVDVCFPCASSGLIGEFELNLMKTAQVNFIVCGANDPFYASKAGISGVVSSQADENMVVIPDFIANSGMARAFTYLYAENAVLDAASILKDIDTTVNNAVVEVLKLSPNGGNFSKNALDIALSNLSN